MSAGSDVVVTGRIGKGSFEIIRELTNDAIMLAIEKTKTEAIQYEMQAGSPVPKDTGRLRSSFIISIVSQTIAMKWSAIDPAGKGYDYADIVDQRQPYSQKLLEWVKQRLHANLIAQLKILFAGVTI